MGYCRTTLIVAAVAVTAWVAMKFAEMKEDVFYASNRGDFDLVRQELPFLTAANQTDSYGNSLCHWAAKGGSVRIMQLLQSQGLSCCEKNSQGSTRK